MWLFSFCLGDVVVCSCGCLVVCFCMLIDLFFLCVPRHFFVCFWSFDCLLKTRDTGHNGLVKSLVCLPVVACLVFFESFYLFGFVLFCLSKRNVCFENCLFC